MGYADKVTYTMATYYGRILSLKAAVKTILPQCDSLRVYLNGYPEVPKFLANELKVTVIDSSKYGICGDAGKFHGVENISGYHFTVDDDILYPPDYTNKMVSTIERYGRKAIVGVHGSIVDMRRFRSYYGSRIVFYYGRKASEQRVNVLGTGTVAYHRSTLKICRDDFLVPNMADVWFAIAAQRSNIPCVMIGRRDAWLRTCAESKGAGSIHQNSKNSFHGSLQTYVVKKHGNWRVV